MQAERIGSVGWFLAAGVVCSLALLGCGDDAASGDRPRGDSGAAGGPGRDDAGHHGDAAAHAPDAAAQATSDAAMDAAAPDLDAGADAAMDAAAPDLDASADAAIDAAAPDLDAGADAAIDAAADGGAKTLDPTQAAATSAAIASARAAANGVIDVALPHALVTYVVDAVGNEPAGFFVQAEATGPALFIAVDPATLTTAPVAGDLMHLTVAAVSTVDGMKHATALGWSTILGSGYDLSALVQDVSAASDLVSASASYESELLRVTGSIDGPMLASGLGHTAARLATVGVPSDADLLLRVPQTLSSERDLVSGCSLTVESTPLKRYNARSEVSAWRAPELTGLTCPAPRVLSARPLSAHSAVVNFDRHLDPASVTANGAQFSGDNGLTVSAAAVSGDGTRVTLTTSAQTPAQSYQLTVAPSVQDSLGAALNPSYDGAQLRGYELPAVVRINEINANIGGGCDLVELRVVAGGSMSGFELWDRDGAVVQFADLDVATNAYLVVHWNSTSPTCNPTSPPDETTGPNAQPSATHAANYDAAYDWYTVDTTITSTDNVLSLYDATGAIVEAVLVSDDATGTAAGASESQAQAVAAAGQWSIIGGGVPNTGFIDDAFCANAVLDLNATGTTAAGASMQRVDNLDRNTKADWDNTGTVTATWGANNPGQTNF